jgi:O-antigen/teichoic acid export membrane protein
MVKYILNSEQAGYYSIAAAMADMVYMLPVVIGTILFPKLSAISCNQERWEFAKKVSVGVMLVIVVLASFAAFLADPIVRLLFGEIFMPAKSAFIWLLPGIVMLSVNTIFMNYFASIGMPLITVYCPSIAAIFNIALNMKLIPLFGIKGAAISSVASYAIMLCGNLLYFHFKKTM